MQSNLFVIDISNERSSLIRRIEWNENTKILTVYFRKYYTDHISYEEVYENHFEEFSKQSSIGKYYLHYIKPNFKQLKTNFMSENNKRPPTKNQASEEKRFIKISLNVQKIKKEWLTEGEKGVYLNITLQLLPDGKLDKLGNLGMVVQDVPKEIYEKEKNLPKEQRTMGPILGNGCEFDWQTSLEGQPGTNTSAGVSEEVLDDLPF